MINLVSTTCMSRKIIFEVLHLCSKSTAFLRKPNVFFEIGKNCLPDKFRFDWKLRKNEKMYELPEEIWTQIFSFLPFETLHKTCTLVSSKWFEMIRKTSRFSKKLLAFSSDVMNDIKPEDFNEFLLRNWPFVENIFLSPDQKILTTGLNFQVISALMPF